MDNFRSCVARRTRHQTDLYIEELYRKSCDGKPPSRRRKRLPAPPELLIQVDESEVDDESEDSGVSSSESEKVRRRRGRNWYKEKDGVRGWNIVDEPEEAADITLGTPLKGRERRESTSFESIPLESDDEGVIFLGEKDVGTAWKNVDEPEEVGFTSGTPLKGRKSRSFEPVLIESDDDSVIFLGDIEKDGGRHRSNVRVGGKNRRKGGDSSKSTSALKLLIDSLCDGGEKLKEEMVDNGELNESGNKQIQPFERTSSQTAERLCMGMEFASEEEKLWADMEFALTTETNGCISTPQVNYEEINEAANESLCMEMELASEEDKLWADMEFALKTETIGCISHPQVEDEEKNEERDQATPLTLCSQGKHNLILDEQIGQYCKYCSYVDVEIKYIVPPMVDSPLEGCQYNSQYGEGNVLYVDNDDQFGVSESGSGEFSYYYNYGKGTVWDIIPGIRDSMYPHQQEGFEFIWTNLEGSIYLDELKNNDLDSNGGCIISHVPGTGKTRLTIVFLQTYLERYPDCKPLIIAPASILCTWENEFKKWGMGIPFHNLNSELSGKEHEAALSLLKKHRHQNLDKTAIRFAKLVLWKKHKSILGISYSLYEKLAGENFVVGSEPKKKRKNLYGGDKSISTQKKADLVFQSILRDDPNLVVLDEGHTPRNHRSGIWKALAEMKCDKRILLSGTLFQNNFSELYNTLRLVVPSFHCKIPESLNRFLQISAWEENNGLRRKQAPGNSTGKLAGYEIEKLRSWMAPFVHVYKGSILQKNLPGLKDCAVVLKPDDLQEELLSHIMKFRQNALEYEHKMALVCVHPSLLLRCPSEVDESVINMRNLENLKLNPSVGVKTRFVVEFARLCETLNEKLLVFSQYIPPLDLLTDQLNSLFSWSEGNEVLRMDGKMDPKQRQSTINSFNDPNSAAKILLASTKACSEGINLVGASRVVLLDVVWNPSVERQAISRAYRLGQKKVVYTYNLIMGGTTELIKYGVQTQKNRVSELVFASSDGEIIKTKDSIQVSDDKVLNEMVSHDKLKSMFARIIYQPKETDLGNSGGSVMLP